MGEVYNKVYRPIGEATYGHIVFREFRVLSADLVLNTGFTSNDLTVDFQGTSRQAFKVMPKHTGGGAPTLDVEIQEFVPFPGHPNDGDGANGTWATKSGLGVGNVAAGVLFEHNQEDTMRLARLLLTPRVAVLDGDIDVVIEGRRDT